MKKLYDDPVSGSDDIAFGALLQQAAKVSSRPELRNPEVELKGPESAAGAAGDIDQSDAGQVGPPPVTLAGRIFGFLFSCGPAPQDGKTNEVFMMFSVPRAATLAIATSLAFLSCAPAEPAAAPVAVTPVPAAPADPAPVPVAPVAVTPAPAAPAEPAPVLAAPAAAPPAAASLMAPELKRLSYMEGNWKCAGKDNTADFAAEFAMDGRWIKTHFHQKGGMNSWIESFMTWMPDRKEIVLVGVDSTGGYIVEPFVDTENGGIKARGGIFYPNTGKPSGWKDEIVKKSDTELQWIAHMQTGTGWQLAWDDRCIKQLQQ